MSRQNFVLPKESSYQSKKNINQENSNGKENLNQKKELIIKFG